MFFSEQNAEMGMERRGGYFFSRKSVFLVRNQDNSVTVLRHHFFMCASAQNLNTRKKSMCLGLYFIEDVLWWRLLLSLPFACYIVCTLVHFSKNVISYGDNNWSLCCVISSFYRVSGWFGRLRKLPTKGDKQRPFLPSLLYQPIARYILQSKVTWRDKRIRLLGFSPSFRRMSFNVHSPSIVVEHRAHNPLQPP